MIRYIVLALLALALLITAAVAFTIHFAEKHRVRRAAERERVIASGQPDLRPDPHPPNDHLHDSAGFIVDQLGAQGQQTAQQTGQGQQQARAPERALMSDREIQEYIRAHPGISQDLGRSMQQMQRNIGNSLRDAISGIIGRPDPGAVNIEIRTTMEGAPDQVVADILRHSIQEYQENHNQQPAPAEPRRMADAMARRVQQLGRQGTAPAAEEPRPEPKTRFQRDPVI